MSNKLSDKNTEATLLSAMVSNKDAFIVAIRELTEEYFQHPITRALFNILVELEKTNTPVDIITIINVIEEKNLDISIPEVNEILDLDWSGNNYKAYIHILFRYYCKKLRYNMIMSLRKAVANNESDEFIAEIIETYERQIQFESKSKSNSVCTIIEKNIDTLEKIHREGGNIDIGLNIGFESINKNFRLKRGELYVMAGKTSMGKTSMAVRSSFLISTLYSKRVLFFTLETTEDQIFDKIICQYFNMSNNDLDYLDCVEKSDYYSKIHDIFSGTGDNFIINDNTFDLKNIKYEAKLENKKKKLDLIVIDHIGLVSGKFEGDSIAGKMKHICRELKILSKELNIPIIVLSQLKRAHQQRDESKVPVNTDLYGGALENDACVIGFVYRPEYYELKEFAGRNKEQLENVAYFVIRKNRYGATGMIELEFDKHSANFKDIGHNNTNWNK